MSIPSADQVFQQLGDIIPSIRLAVVEACRMCSQLPSEHPNLEPTALWRMIHSDLRGTLKRQLDPFIDEGRVRVTEESQLLLVVADEQFAVRTHFLPPSGRPSRNRTRRTRDSYDQQLLGFMRTSDSDTTVLLALYEVDPAMEQDPTVYLACMLGTEYIWRREIDAGDTDTGIIGTTHRPTLPADDAPLLPAAPDEAARRTATGGDVSA